MPGLTPGATHNSGVNMKQTFTITIEQPDDAKPISADYIRGRAYEFGATKDCVYWVEVEEVKEIKRNRKKEYYNIFGAEEMIWSSNPLREYIIEIALNKEWDDVIEEKKIEDGIDYDFSYERTIIDILYNGKIEVSYPEFEWLKPIYLDLFDLDEAISDDERVTWAKRSDGTIVLLSLPDDKGFDEALKYHLGKTK